QPHQHHGRRRMNPGKRSPLWVRNLKQAHRQQQKKRGDREQCGNCLSSSNFEFRISNFGFRPIPPPKPEQVQCEKRNEPAKTVLFVYQPFATELSAKYKPEGG